MRVALALLPVASTRNWALPAEYSANWIEMLSAATVVGVRVFVGEAIAVGVRVAVGGKVEVGVAEGPVVGEGRVEVGVAEGPMGVGVAIRRITNERTVDQAPFVPLAVLPRTRHQNVRSLVNVCVVWV